MKKLTLGLLSVIGLSLSWGVFAQDTYQAPELKLQEVAPSVQVESSASWRNHYRVNDKPAADRALASDEWVDHEEEKASRDPSSVEEEVPSHSLRPWRFYPAQ